MTVSTQDIERLQGLLEKATPGEWTSHKISIDEPPFSYIIMASGYGVVGYHPKCEIHPDPFWRLTKDDAEFIVEGKAFLPALLSERTDLEAEVAALESNLTELMANCKMSIAIAQIAEAENARLREALKPFADYVTPDPPFLREEDIMTKGSPLARKQVCVGDFRRAARALLHEGEK